MNVSSNPRSSAPPQAVLRTLAAAAMWATTVLVASTAQAGLIVTSAQRSVSADTNRTAADADSTAATAGTFARAVKSQVFLDTGDGAAALAEQNTTLAPLLFSGTGSAELKLFDNTGGNAESILTVLFTLTTSYSFSGLAELSASGNAPSAASFDLDRLGLGGGSIVSGSAINPLSPFGGTLGPGDYSLNLRATSASIDPNEDGSARFDFRLAFTDLGTPPAAVPEPQALALALGGLLACGATRRRNSRAAAQAM